MRAPRPAGFEPFTFDTPSQTLAGWTAGAPVDRDAGAPVLFVHPIGLHGLAWAEVARLIGGAHASLLPDLRGHGRSTAVGPFGVDAWVEDLIAVLDHFDVRRCHVVGGAVGGALAVALADRIPGRVLSVAAFGSALALEGEYVESSFDPVLRGDLPELFDDAPPSARTVGAIWRAALEADVRGLAGGVRVSALIGSGELDRVCPPEQGRTMAGALGAEFVTLPEVGHLPMLDAPEQVGAVLVDFLRQVDRVQAAAPASDRELVRTDIGRARAKEKS